MMLLWCSHEILMNCWVVLTQCILCGCVRPVDHVLAGIMTIYYCAASCLSLVSIWRNVRNSRTYFLTQLHEAGDARKVRNKRNGCSWCHWRIQKLERGGIASAVTRIYNGGIGVEPATGFRGRTPGQASGSKPEGVLAMMWRISA